MSLSCAAGLPLLQPCHRSLVKPAFTAVAKALEAVGSPWTKLRAALHLEVAKSEADADSFIKVRADVHHMLTVQMSAGVHAVTHHMLLAAICAVQHPHFVNHAARR